MSKAAKATTGGLSLRDRILKNSTVKETAILSESDFFRPKDFIKTQVVNLNVALSGDVDGGMIPGVLMIAGPSRHFKTGFALMFGKAFLDKYDDGLILFYDSEFGSPQSYFAANGIDLDRVIHTPITDVEQLKHDMTTQLLGLTNIDHVMIICDSIGNLASKKEIKDALKDDDEHADYTRAKALKSLFRLVTPHLTIKGIPLIAINHSYKTIEMYSKDQVGGGTGGIYASNDIWILGRRQRAEGEGASKQILGWQFVINIEKSRFVKEKSKFFVDVDFSTGVNRYSGLFDEAREFGIVVPASKTNFWVVDGQDPEDKNLMFKRSDVENSGDFWRPILSETTFKDLLKEKYQLPRDQLMIQAEFNPETGEVIEE